MKNIKLSSSPELEARREIDWSMQFVDETNFDVLYNEDVTISKPDGSPLLVLLKKSLSERAVQQAWSILKDVNLKSRNRGVAAGRENEIQSKTGKTIESPKGWDVTSGIIGYFERTVRMPFCRSCAWNQKYPEKFAKLLPMIKEVDERFERNVPERYAVQKEYALKTSPDFVIPGTVFTTLTVNKTFRTACHKDAGDLEKGFSCLSVIRKGHYRGGHLVLPAWRIAVELDTYDLVLFDAHEFHGNTQIVPISNGAVRCSIVYYYREGILKCKSALAELEYAKNRKLGDSLWD